MDELNQNQSTVENSDSAMKCDQNMPKKQKTPALFKAGIAVMCATSALSLGAIGVSGILGYKLYKEIKNNSSKKPEDSMGSVVTNKNDSISISSDGYWVINGVKTNTKAEASNGSDGVSVVSASVVKLDKWGITTQILFTMSDNSYLTTAPQTQVLNDHYYEASSMSDVMTLVQGYKVSKIKLSSNINLSSSVEFEGSTTFDLNKKTLTYSGTRALEVADESSLTFKNGSLVLQTDVGVSINGANSELAFEKVNISATEVIAETLEENASINLDNCTFTVAQPARMMFSAGQNSGVGSLFVVKGSNASLAIKGSKFETSRAIVSASENAESINLKIQETKLTTSAPILDINTDEVIPTLDVDQDTIKNSTITELNTTPITSGTFNVDPTELGATLVGESFNVNGSSVIASDFAELISKVEAGSTITLSNDVVFAGENIDTEEARLYIDKNLTIDLNGYSINGNYDNGSNNYFVFRVRNGAKLVINDSVGTGYVSAYATTGAYALYVDGGELVINGGTFVGNPTAVNVKTGKVTINGGMFASSDEDSRYVINCIDANFRDKTAVVEINGGLFLNYNPAASVSEGPVVNFVSENKIITGFTAQESMCFYYVTDSNNLTEIISNGFTKLNEFVDEEGPVSMPVDYIMLNGNVEISGAEVDTYEARLYVDKDLTIDLNGYSINGNYGNGDNNFFVFRVRNGATLTINDTVGTGSITAYATTGAYALYVDGGTLVVNGGAITGNPTAVNVLEGNAIINGGTFASSETTEYRYVINCIDANYRNKTAVVEINGGTFENYNPAATISEGSVVSFVTEGLFVVENDNNYTVVSGTLNEVIANAEAGSTINLTSNVVFAGADIDTQEARLYIDKDLTIDLNGYSINGDYGKGDNNFFVFRVRNGATLVIDDSVGGGAITAYATTGAYALYVDGGTLVVNGGTITGNPTAVNVNVGKVVINDGTFVSSDEDKRYVVNCIDANYRNETAIVEINGGTFENYNPAATISEGPVANFVTEGKVVVEKDGVYTIAASLVEAAADTSVDSITLAGNFVLTQTINVKHTLTLNLNGFNISRPTHTGTQTIAVYPTGDLTIEGEGTIDGCGASEYDIAVWVYGGKLTINGGTFSNLNAGEDPQYDLIYASHGGQVIINAGTFTSKTPAWILNLQDNSGSSIVVNGGTFVGYNPAESHTEPGGAANFVAANYLIYKVGNNYTVAPESELVNIISNNAGATIILTSSYVVDGEVTINLNGCTITAPHSKSTTLFSVGTGSVLTINGEGTINSASDSNDYSMAIWAYNGGQVVINGGTFTNLGGKSVEDDGVTPNNNELLYVSGSGSSIVINDGIFIGNSENETWGTRYTLNKADGCNSSIVVNGGTFVKYDPSMSKSESPIANFVAEGKFVYKVGNNYSVASLENLVDVINNNAGADIMLPTAYVVNTTLTINLNGCTISTPNDTVGDGVFHVVEGGILTINGEGTINGVGAGDYHMAIWVHGGKVTINGGTFTNVGATESGEPADQFDLMYVKGGELVINGGTFTSETPKWTLNLNDKIAGTITVCGGTFLGYNPTESHSENPVANFIAEGYKAVLEGNNYTVVAE